MEKIKYIDIIAKMQDDTYPIIECIKGLHINIDFTDKSISIQDKIHYREFEVVIMSFFNLFMRMTTATKQYIDNDEIINDFVQYLKTFG